MLGVDVQQTRHAAERAHNELFLRIGKPYFARLPLRAVDHLRHGDKRLQRVDHLVVVELIGRSVGAGEVEIDAINARSAFGLDARDDLARPPGDEFDGNAEPRGEFGNHVVAHHRVGRAGDDDLTFFLSPVNDGSPFLIARFCLCPRIAEADQHVHKHDQSFHLSSLRGIAVKPALITAG